MLEMESDDRVETLLASHDLADKARELGRRIEEDYTGLDEPLMLVGVLKGCFVFLSDLCRSIRLPLEVEFISVSSYGSEKGSSGSVRDSQRSGQQYHRAPGANRGGHRGYGAHATLSPQHSEGKEASGAEGLHDAGQAHPTDGGDPDRLSRVRDSRRVRGGVRDGLGPAVSESALRGCIVKLRLSYTLVVRGVSLVSNTMGWGLFSHSTISFAQISFSFFGPMPSE